MEELYSIMRDFLEVEYNQESLLSLLKAAELSYSEESQEETKLILNSIKYYLKAIQVDLRASIHKLDFYMTEKLK